MSRKTDLDNHSNQLNPNHPEYLNCRGHRNSEQDEDWDTEKFSAPAYFSKASTPTPQTAFPRSANFVDTIEFPAIVPEKLPVHLAAFVTAFEKIKI